MIVTDIQAQKKKPTRVSIYIDGAFWLGLEGALAAELGIRQGISVTEEQQRQWQERIGEYEALDRAITFLGYRMRTESEVRRKFSEDYPEEILDFVIQKLVGYGYINDAVWMEELVRSAGELGKGKRWIDQKAWQAGVDTEHIQAAMDGYQSDDQESAALEYCHRSRLTAEDTGKLWRRLASRGYSPDVIIAVKDQLIKEAKGEDD